MEENKLPFTKESFCTRLGFDEKYFYRSLYPYWDEFCEKCDCRKPFFAEKSFYTKWHALVNNDTDILKRMEIVEKIFENDPAVSFFANILHYSFFVREEPCNINPVPESIDLFGENSGIFFLLVAESNFPAIEKAYKELSLPEEYLHGVGKWIDGTIKIYKAAHNGIPGHTVTQTSWIRKYSRKTLFRIGRFEFLLHPYIQWMPCIYVNEEGTAIAFHKDGSFLRKDGRRMYKETEGCIKVFCREDEGYVTGCPILPDGSSDPECYIRLPLDKWRALCTPWDIVPSVHIPGGERMDRDEVNATFTKANAFFSTYFHFVPKVYGCYSWILNPDLREVLPDSNMVHFQDQGYKIPAWGGITPGSQDGVFFVFGRNGKVELDKIPCNNKMEEAMIKLYREKSTLRSGALFILSSDADKVGSRYYLENFHIQKKIVEENRTEAIRE